eukprot:CAMPEP_0179251578 /NCGR_PEP_ID=MMETSP0797-20121207/21759_1 /TAXON_ID=47934 /ORGANISM="Dinophysis acuminata, Strain DAEP01" /LENGTH=108 /DNA_ID=CAMNT_0020959357 /DNA_START=83 /DNA_END=406 /DNA_ORIENTATION=-
MAFILALCVFAKATRPSDDGGMELEGHDETTGCRTPSKCCCCKQTKMKIGGGGYEVQKSEVDPGCSGEPTDCKTKCEAQQARRGTARGHVATKTAAARSTLSSSSSIA